VNIKVRKLIGLDALGLTLNTSKPVLGHKVYP